VPPRHILVVNAGSSTLKLRLLDAGDALEADAELPAAEDPRPALEEFLAGAPEPDAAGHRVVHGGSEYVAATRVDHDVEAHLEALRELAPLHNPPALAAIHALARLRPELPAVACFDTAFHAGLPAAAATYALPEAWRRRWPLRRFGFHGLSHAYVAQRTAELCARPAADLRIVSAHLGGGASLAAVGGGRSVDTTMGFTPLEGLVMATRSGSVDPGLILWLERRGGLDAAEIETALEAESGLVGLSGTSSRMGDLLAASRNGDERAGLAVDVYVHRLRAGIAAMAAALEGLDALAFTGGVGEHEPEVRSLACRGLGFLDVELDGTANERASAGADAILDSGRKRVRVVLVHAREDLEIAAQVRAVLQ